MARLAFAAQEMLKRDNDHVVIEIRVLGPLELRRRLGDDRASLAVEESDVLRAGELLRRALPVLRQLGAYRLIEYLDSCAGLACAVGRCETAARLTGAADAALDEMGARMVPADVVMRERRIATARETLGEERFESLQRDGRALSLDEALDVARGEVLAEAAH